MRTTLAVAALLALPLAASAGDPDWAFKAGQTFTYQCSTEFHYVAYGQTFVHNGRVVRRGGADGWNGGSSSTGSSDPQWEKVTLRATVLGVLDDGSARIEFQVTDVSIETRFDSNGDHAQWDSKKSRRCDVAAYAPYEALLDFTFDALIAPDGTVREINHASYPAGRAIAAGDAREERAASATHDPTSAATWLSLIFSTAPERTSKWQRTLLLPDAHNLDVKFDGKELSGRIPCVRSKFKTSDRQPAPPDDDAGQPIERRRIARTLERVSLDNLAAADKRGTGWFSRDLGCLVKAELAARTTTEMGGTMVSSAFLWEVKLVSRGVVGPVYGPAVPDGYGFDVPVETPDSHPDTQVQGSR